MAASSSMINTDPIDEWVLFIGREMTAASDIDSLPGQRKIQIEPRAFPGTALDPNLPRMFLNDSVTHRQSQPGAPRLALARRFGGEEGIVNALDVFLRNPRPSIRNHHTDAFAVGSRDPQRAAVCHRILGVQKQVQEN